MIEVNPSGIQNTSQVRWPVLKYSVTSNLTINWVLPPAIKVFMFQVISKHVKFSSFSVVEILKSDSKFDKFQKYIEESQNSVTSKAPSGLN